MPRPTSNPVDLLTSSQRADFTACAESCGLTLAQFMVQATAVCVANRIDAVQAAERKARLRVKQVNEDTTARLRKQRARKQIESVSGCLERSPSEMDRVE